MNDVTRILNSYSPDDPQAAEELLPLVYHELRKLAAAKMANEKPGQTLQATALVHEAWLKLAGEDTDWKDRHHFIRAAAEAMRRILVDRARARNRQKRQGSHEHIPLEGLDIAAELDDDRLLRVNELLDQLGATHPEKAELVKLRFFVGLRIEDAARSIGISPMTAKRHWNYARAWLLTRLAEST
jgi:RNA polymerase sigma factor (TIGR02999 family)